MEAIRDVAGMQLDEDMGFTRREWMIERLAWGVMAALLLATLVGVFGRGPLAQREAETGGLKVTWDMIGRHESPFELRLQLSAELLARGGHQVWMSRALAEELELRQITPEPEHTRGGDDRVVFEFALSGQQRGDVVFHVRPERMWLRRGELGIVDGPSLPLTMFVLP